jgi:dephospho-CoA kinase
MKVIGIVGGIASGKSFVSECFQNLGAKVLDADRIGHEVLKEPSVKQQIRTGWGNEVFKSDGEVDRPAMARSVFGLDPESRERLSNLESITHPRIADRMREELDTFAGSEVPAVVLDAPVLIKAGWDRFCDRIVFVDASDAMRRKRAIERGWNESEWRRRETLQLPLAAIRQRADAIIDNSGSRESTIQQVAALWRKWGLPTTESRAR